MTLPTQKTPIHQHPPILVQPQVQAVYPIVSSGPAVIILSEHSKLFRVAIAAPTTPPEDPPNTD